MSDYNPAASAPPLQGPALPPDWHLICCDEDHGSPSRMAYAPENDSRQQQRASSSTRGQPAGNFAWMSCCEDEACVSPPVDDNRHRQQSYNFTTGRQASTHATRRDETSCGYDATATDCCGPITSPGANAKGLAHCAEAECPPDTICCESIHPGMQIAPMGHPGPHGGTGTAPMDCTEEGCCDLDEFVCQDHDMVGACVSFSFLCWRNLFYQRKNRMAEND